MRNVTNNGGFHGISASATMYRIIYCVIVLYNNNRFCCKDTRSRGQTSIRTRPDRAASFFAATTFTRPPDPRKSPDFGVSDRSARQDRKTLTCTSPLLPSTGRDSHLVQSHNDKCTIKMHYVSSMENLVVYRGPQRVVLSIHRIQTTLFFLHGLNVLFSIV